MSDKSNVTETGSDYVELVENILSQLEVFLSSRVKELFDKTDDFLFNSADHASSIDEQNRLFEFMNALRVVKGGIETTFVTEFNNYLKPISENKILPSKKRHTDDNTLGLIDQGEMDEMLAITGISGKAKMDNQEAISHLEARLEHLGLQTQHIFLPKALDPVHLCSAFQEALGRTEFTTRDKLILYKMFGQEVALPLHELYQQLNELMIEAGVLPQIELSGKIKKTEEAAQTVQGADEAYDEAADAPEQGGVNVGGHGLAGRTGGGMGGAGMAGGGASAGGSGGMAGGGASAGGSGGMAGGGAGAGGSGGMAGGGTGAGGSGGMAGGGTGAGGSGGMAGGGTGAGGSGGMAGGGTGAGGSGGAGMSGSGGAAGEGSNTGTADGSGHSSSTGDAGDQTGSGGGLVAGFPVSEVRESIASFVGGKPGDVGAGGGGGYYSHQDTLGALTEMQSRAQVNPQADLEFNASSIKKTVQTTIGEKDGGAVTKRVNQVSEKTIDFIKLIFDAIIEDQSITDTIKALLLSLQIPVIKAAMIDSEFFLDDQHPARLLLDKLAEAGVGINDHHDEIYKDLTRIVSALLRDYDEDIIAFKVALDALNILTETIYANAQEKQEASQKQVKYAHARNIVLQEIRKITLGKELPRNVRKLVLKVWPSLMFNHYLHSGKANDEWVEMLMIMDKVIESVQPLMTQEDQEELGLSHEDIVNAVEARLTKSQKTQQLIDDVIVGLTSTYSELMKIQNLPEVADEAEAENITESTDDAEEVEASVEEVAETTVEDIEPEETQNALESLPDDVQPGTWFIVYNGEEHPVRRLKLAVILTDDATLVFVDHLGNVVIEKTAKAFTDEMERGLSGVIMQHSVFDHALRSALQIIKS